MTKCKECGRCTYDGVMTELCLSKEVREKLLELIYEGVKLQINTENFLYDRGISNMVIDSIAKGVKIHFDCLLPNKYEGNYIRK